MAAGRSLRPRAASQYANQVEWDLDEETLTPFRNYDIPAKFSHYRSKPVDDSLVQCMSGENFTLRHVRENGLKSCLVFHSSTGLGIKVPPSHFSVEDVKRFVGSKREVDVMDTLTQRASTMTMAQWAAYYSHTPRTRILNVISLELSCTRLAEQVEPPSVVRELDWVELAWPSELKAAQTDPTNDMRRMMFPKVQKYCLMSVAGCFTDFHLDFGGTSVWYHVTRGSKLFILIPPSPEVYELFHIWQLSGEQEGVFFADLVEVVFVLELTAGDTFIMPSGWVHAVYTPEDSLVFGGNFLHSYNIPQQLAVAAIEARTKVPLKFRYPFYGTIHWYIIMRYANQLRRAGLHPPGHAHNRLKEVSIEKLAVSWEHGYELSETEVSGLMELVQRMEKDELFLKDAPPSLANPTGLLKEVASQLAQWPPSSPAGLGDKRAGKGLSPPTKIPKHIIQ